MQIWAVMMVRDEADIIAVNVLHHLNAGIDRFLIVDDGSSDGTDDVLRELSRDERVRWSRQTGLFQQAATTTALAREACRQGADWVLPIDADEFWYTPGGDLHDVLAATNASALEVEIVNFIQRRAQIDRSSEALLHATRRTISPIGPVDRTRQLVESRQIAFVEMQYPSKWISRASTGVEIAQGNHGVAGVPGSHTPIDSIACLHVPIRARTCLASRLAHGRRVEEIGLPAGFAWHVRRLIPLDADAGLDAEWRANSYEGDWLDVHGALHPVVFDPRLRDLVAPWMAPAAAVSARALSTSSRT
jgi:hypothetical protein